ncbi:hypothetical protein FDP41_013042 [Naegleria fowleri]|uniref:C2 domain-containing protein n=1 Tax=Naegleria fowleri TaxID=5763 RepID=A0A6A5C424_NAEFO|nr:uncharacterized protein FDP41_013042 [Naegleria fowleri]KAF0981254.1 hypothetical protein FDP41_013042 [Naegleria fowleri]CAG4708161.1 unnamed protein product [Naegleria fowleri]
MVLHVTVIGATNLERKHSDSSYSSDPFVVVSLDHKQFANGDYHFRTSVQKNTLNPQFNETFQFTLPKNSSFGSIDVIFEVYDWKVIGKNASMGQAQANLSILRRQLKTVCECTSKANTSLSLISSNGNVNSAALGSCDCSCCMKAMSKGIVTSDSTQQQPCETTSCSDSRMKNINLMSTLMSNSIEGIPSSSSLTSSSSSLYHTLDTTNSITSISDNRQIPNPSDVTSPHNSKIQVSERKCTCHHRKIYKREPQRLKLELIGYMHKGNSFIEVELMADENDFKKCH